MNKNAKTITACVSCAAAVGLGAFALYLNKDKKSVPTVDSVPEAVTEAATEANAEKLSADWADNYDYVPSLNGVCERTKSLMRLNKDIMGWVKIDGTQVDYPFLRDPGEVAANDPYYGPDEWVPNSYYLEKDIFRQYYDRGTFYADYRNNFGGDESQQSDNLVIYGHNWYDGTMMGSLRKYRPDPEFYEQHPFIQVSSNYKEYDYVVFAYLITSGSYNATDFHYWDMEDFDTEEDFKFYIDNCRGGQLLDTGVDVKYGDKLLTLSTCYADYDNSRFIVVARRLRDGEVAGDMTTIQHTEEYLKKKKEEAEKASKEEAEKAANEEKPQ